MEFHSGRAKEAFYDSRYLNRSESLDWADFQARTKSSNTNKRDEVESVIDDVDGTAGQLQTAAGPAPRITIRYNDPGSLESVIPFSILDCHNK